MMADEFPVDFTTEVGRVRKYIPDLVQLPDEADTDGAVGFIFSDDEIQSFIDDETQDGMLPTTAFRLHRAAGWAMIALANSENLILKKLMSQDQQTDGPAVAKQLIAAAAAMFSRADKEEAAVKTVAETTEGFYAVFPPSPASYALPEGTERVLYRGWL
jgi:hypothetical protein